jgi:hypothetical protein
MMAFSESCSSFLSLSEDEHWSPIAISVVSESWVLFPYVESLSVSGLVSEDSASGRGREP